MSLECKTKNIEVEGKTYTRVMIKTDLFKFGDDLLNKIAQYVKPELKAGDWLAISEKVVSICQNNVVHISQIKATWLAKLIVKGVKKYPNDIGFSLPEKMQVAINIVGYPRMMLAMVLGTMGKILGIRGIFWIVAGHRVSEIDGFNPASMYPYNEYAALPPQNPRAVCQEIEDKLGMPAVIIDGNNINVKIIATSSLVSVSKKMARLVLLDNPMGQNDEMTPFVLVRLID